MQPRLHVRVGQKQVMTPGLVQMVNVLALNKAELKEMIEAEVVANPVLEEIDETTESLAETDGREASSEKTREEKIAEESRDEKDAFAEIDLDSYFRDYLEPGFRAAGPSFEESDAPSFEQFLTKAGTLTDHLLWQVGSLALQRNIRSAVETIIGNLDANGYLIVDAEDGGLDVSASEDFGAGLQIVQSLDPCGVGARDLRECLLLQLRGMQGLQESVEARCAMTIVEHHLDLVAKHDLRGLAKVLDVENDAVDAAMRVVRSLDPRPGQRFAAADARLIEPDVAFVRRGDGFIVVMNEEDLPALRLHAGYRRMLQRDAAEREVQEYVKDRYRAAIQLLRNIEQRKNTIVKTCEAILRRQGDFLEHGIDSLRPMMIKEVAEEIGVHPSTVSRAVANKYVLTPQGVFELRFFFTEAVAGSEGADLPLMLLKKRVRKMIEEEDPREPWTDEALAGELQRQGIQVTRRTVAKYREEMNLPSTHQRRLRA